MGAFDVIRYYASFFDCSLLTSRARVLTALACGKLRKNRGWRPALLWRERTILKTENTDPGIARRIENEKSQNRIFNFHASYFH